ncbi:MAG: hypothetical protein NTV02_00780 [Candidatus Zambryskibacteria bacterium]|nr:hypothetical protein [Candidatus Zambryskibacteria bacterium]
MNRNVLIGLVVVLLIAIGVWMWISSDKDDTLYTAPTNTTATSTNINTSTTTTPKPVTTGTNPSANTFQSIITQKGSYQCTFSQATQGGQTISNIYIADGKLRGEFRDTDSVGNMMIYNNGTLYIWQEGKTVGTKSQVSTLAQLPSVIPKDLTSGSSLGSGINAVGWDCRQSSNAASLFVPSSVIKFTAN